VSKPAETTAKKEESKTKTASSNQKIKPGTKDTPKEEEE